METNKKYDKFLPIWTKCRDAVDGEESIKSGGTKYLPKTNPGQPEDQYKSYLQRSVYLPMSGRAVDGYMGMLNRKPPVIELPPGMMDWSKDVTMAGSSLKNFIKTCEKEVLTVGRFGVLVDYPMIEEDTEITQAQADSMGLRPRFASYRAEKILDWDQDWINGSYRLSEVFLSDCDDRFRELKLENGIYIVRVYEKEEDEDELKLISEIIPKIAGMPLDFIPFQFLDSLDGLPDPEYPPINDLVNMNLAHFRNSADYENSLFVTSNPTPIFTGFSEDDFKGGAKLGPYNGIVSTRADAKATFLEYQGQGITPEYNEMKHKEELMAVLGARMLATEKDGTESGKAVALRQSGEDSILAGIASSISESVTILCQVAALWMGENPEEVKIEINTDFSAVAIDSALLQVLFGALIQGKYTMQDWFRLLKEHALVDKEKEFEVFSEEATASKDSMVGMF